MENLYSYVNTEGVIVPNTQDILAGVQEKFQEIFGADFSLEEATPGGRLIEGETAVRKECLIMNALIANMLNPQRAFGKFLDTHGALFDVKREGETATVVTCKCSGVPGTVIPAGSRAQDSDGNIYVIAGETAIPSSGNVYVQFSNIVPGAIACAANSLNIILDAVEGWEGISNDTSGTLGLEDEDDAFFRIKIDKSKTKYSEGAVISIEGALFAINGLKSYVVLENPTNEDWIDSSTIPDGWTPPPQGEVLLAHSIMVFVYGANMDGTFYQKVADAIVSKKNLGCNMSEVKNSAYVHSMKASNGQPVIFNTAEPLPIYISLSASNVSYTGFDLQGAIKTIISDWFSGNLSGVQGVQIGQEISVFELSNVITSQIGVNIKTLGIGTSAGAISSNPIDVPLSRIATVSPENINVTIVK